MTMVVLADVGTKAATPITLPQGAKAGDRRKAQKEKAGLHIGGDIPADSEGVERPGQIRQTHRAAFHAPLCRRGERSL